MHCECKKGKELRRVRGWGLGVYAAHLLLSPMRTRDGQLVESCRQSHGGLPLARRRQGRFVLQVRAGPGLVAPSARGAAMVPSSGPAGAAKPERRGRLGNMRANIA
jgi:hypothetical protein